MDAASINVVINATDNASGVIAGVAGNISALGSAQGTLAAQTAASGAALTQAAGNSRTLGAAVSGTRNSVGRLETQLESSKKQTREYAVAIRDSAKELKEKQTAVADAARAYRSTQTAVSGNIAQLRGEQTMLAATKNQRQNELTQLQEANRTLAKNSQEYKDNQKAIQWTRAELRSAEKQHMSVTSAIKEQERVLAESKSAYTAAQTAVSDAAKAHDGLKDSYKQSRAAQSQYTADLASEREALAEQERQLERVQRAEEAMKRGSDLKSIGESADKALKPLYAASAASAAGLGMAAKAAIDFEDDFAAVRKTVDGTPEQLDAVKQSIIDMSTVGINGHNAIPLTTAQLTELAAAGGQLGVSVENVADFTETMAMLGTATNLSGEQGAATLARFMNITNTSQDKISNLGSAIVDLGNHFATTEAEIADMALEMGATASVVGISAQDVLAYSTAMSSMGIDAAAGGSAISRIWMDIQSAVSSGGDDLGAFAKVSGKTSEEFAQSWKTDASGAFQDFLKGLGESEDQVKTLSELGFGNIRDIKALQSLAGDRGFELLTKGIEMSNSAWNDNIALQNEFDTKAGTTASQMAVLRNNVTETARSFGEVMLPTLVDVTGGVTGMVQGLAKMDDGAKKALITGGLVTVGLGATAKAATGVVKGVGDITFAVGNVRKALAAGGVFAKAAPTLAGIASAAGPVAFGIAGVAAAAVTAKVAYDKWYNSNYKFAEGLDAQVKKLDESRSKIEELNALRWEYNDLTYRLNQGDMSEEDAEYAKSRLEEIKGILKDKYKIDVDSSDIDAALAKAQQLAEMDAMRSENELIKSMEDMKPKYDKAMQELPKLRQQYAEASAAADRYRDVQSKISDIEQSYGYGEMDRAEYIRQVADAMDAVGRKKDFLDAFKYLGEDTDAAALAMGQLNSSINSLNLDDLKNKIGNYEQNIESYKQAAEELANINLDKFTNALKSGADGTQYLERIEKYVKEGLISADEYAKAVTLISSGQESINEVYKQGGDAVNKYVADYISNMTRFGASAEQTQAGLASLSKAFTDMAHSMGQHEGQHIEITADGTVTWTNDTTEPDSYEPEADGKANFELGDHPEELPPAEGVGNYILGEHPTLAPDIHGTAIYEGRFPTKAPTITGTVIYGVSYSGANTTGVNWTVTKKASGDPYFSGGLAMVNDQRGIADPRELIVDQGRAFIPQGRDVVLPLSRGARIYTAAQTKAIMAGLGIPHYAKGKDNSDSFTNARDDLTHYINTHAVSVTEQFERWNKLLNDAAQNEKDVADAQEQIFRLQTQINKILDDASARYIKNRTFNNDWQEYGDDPISAFNRYNQRQNEIAAKSEQTWEDADKNIRAFGEELLDGRISQSLKWIEREKKYNNLSLADEMKLYQQIQDYVRQYYERGIIDHEKFRETQTDIDERYLDASIDLYGKEAEEAEKARKAEFDRWELDKDNYKRIHDTYGDWDKIGDSVSAMYSRAIVKQKEFYEAGTIGWQEYRDNTLNYALEMYSAASSEYDEALRKQSDAISTMRERFSKQEQELQDSWTVDDRDDDIDEVNRLIGIYNNASTDAGKQKYKELLEQRKQLERQDELYRLQQRHTDILDDMQHDYDRMEANKARALSSLKMHNEDIDTLTGSINKTVASTRDLARTIGIDYADTSRYTKSSLDDIYDMLATVNSNLRANLRRSTNSFTDNRKITLMGNGTDTTKLINGIIVTGMSQL